MATTGLAVIQLVKDEQGKDLKRKVPQESLAHHEAQDAAYAEQKALVRATELIHQGDQAKTVVDCGAAIANVVKGLLGHATTASRQGG